MSDKFVTDTKDHFVVGQTVIAKVMSTDEEKQRVLLNLKVSECSSGNPAAESFSLLNQYFKEVKEIRNLLKRRGKRLHVFCQKGSYPKYGFPEAQKGTTVFLLNERELSSSRDLAFKNS